MRELRLTYYLTIIITGLIGGDVAACAILFTTLRTLQYILKRREWGKAAAFVGMLCFLLGKAEEKGMITWAPKPMQMTQLPDYYAQRSDGTVLPPGQCVLHPMAARIIVNAQDELYQAAKEDWPTDKPIMVFTTMTRDNAFQYRLVVQNRQHRSAQYPNGIPTAVVGKSLHAFGLAVDVNIRQTIANINEAGIDLNFNQFRQFLAGLGAIGISSEAWHYNLLLREAYFQKAGWELREMVYGDNWNNLNDEQKKALLKAAGCTSASLTDLTTEFQSRYSQSLTVDGVCGPNTCRAAYVEWAHKNFQMISDY